MSGSIYYIGCHETKRVKIGFTHGRPIDRLAQLQTGSPTPLALMAVEGGDRDKERRLHEEFRNHRVHGEWFALSDELVSRMMLLVMLEAAHRRNLGQEFPRWVKVGIAAFEDLDVEETSH